MAKTVNTFIRQAPAWQNELKILRAVLQSLPLEETVKWGMPCYVYKGKNVVGIGAFKNYFGLWFHQGALLNDDAKVLINAQPGKTQALRQWRMTSAKDIRKAVIKRYVKASMQNIDAGSQIGPTRKSNAAVPKELASALRRQKGATAAFRQLRPGQQNEYARHVASAKREDTRKQRADKAIPLILAGRGLNDRYR